MNWAQKMKVVVEYNTSHILEINSGDNKKKTQKKFFNLVCIADYIIFHEVLLFWIKELLEVSSV